VTRYETYDVFGNAARVVDPNGVATETTFDLLGRLTTSTTKGISGCDATADPLCATDLTATRGYASGAGPLRLEQRPGGGATVYTYDARGRLQTISRGPAESDLRERIETSYDPLTGKRSLERKLAFEAGRLASIRDENHSAGHQRQSEVGDGPERERDHLCVRRLRPADLAGESGYRHY
jgi:YD repeat-containing protein